MDKKNLEQILLENLEAHRNINRQFTNQVKWALGVFVVFFVSFMINTNGRVARLEERTSKKNYVEMKDFKTYERDKLYIYTRSFECTKPEEITLRIEQKIKNL